MLTHLDRQHSASPTLETCITAWFVDFEERVSIGDASKTTLRKYRHSAKHVAADLRVRPVTAIRRADVRAWHRNLAGRVAPCGRRLTSAADGALKVLACVYSWLLADERCPGLEASPTTGVKRVHKAKIGRSFSDDTLIDWRDALAVHEHARTLRVVGLKMGHAKLVAAYSPTVALALIDLTGARSSEIRTLRIEDLQLERKRFTLRTSKTGEGLARPLSSAAIEVLRRHLARMGNPTSGYLFPSQRRTREGHCISETCLRRTFDKVCAIAGIADAHPHMLRHTLITRGFAAGFTSTATSGAVGHSAEMSFRDYRHLIPGESHDLVEAHAAATMRVPVPQWPMRAGGRR